MKPGRFTDPGENRPPRLSLFFRERDVQPNVEGSVMENLSTTVATQINEAHQAACNAAQSAIEHARRAGDLLMEAKAQIPHGEWLPWLAEHCPTVPERTAQAYMRIASRWPELEAAANTQRVTYLPIRQALALLSTARDEPSEDDDTPLEFERRYATTMAELRVLDRALEGASIEETEAIRARAETVGSEAHVAEVHALIDIGRLDKRARAELGDAIADAIVKDPSAVEEQARRRLAELRAEAE